MDPTAAPVDFQLNGTTYRAYPLRDIDHEAYNKWVRREYMSRVRESLEGDDDLMGIALSRVSTMTWMAGDGLRVAMTVAGLQKLAQLMCRDQRLPEEQKVYASKSVLDHIYDVYRELHPMESSNGSGGGQANATPK